jgi:hydroxymethylglutaryl-CoA lyase
MASGVARFDAMLAGLGGCPHAPGASGNAASEGLAFMGAGMGIDTGIDIERLLALRADVADWRADVPKNFHPHGAAPRAA